MKKLNFLGFSLIELLISLIIIGVITAAFAPVMTKKLQKEKTALSFKTTTKCDDINSDCKLCATLGGSKKCLSCNKKCSSGQYLDVPSCSCASCSDNCLICSSNTNCSSCREGYGLKNNKCTVCPSKTYSLGKTDCKPCPGGFYNLFSGQSNCKICERTYYCQNGERKDCPDGQYSEAGASYCASCPKGYYCHIGIKYSCPSNSSSLEGAKKVTDCVCNAGYYNASSGGVSCYICPIGSYCSQGVKSGCSGNKITSSTGASNSSSCNTCANNYYMENGICKNCPVGFYCTNDEKISCKVFGENCERCNSQKCLSCKEKSGFLEDGICKDCKKFGEYCSKCNSIGCTADGCSDTNYRYSVSGKYYCFLDFASGGFPNSPSSEGIGGIEYLWPNNACQSGKCCWYTAQISPASFVCNEGGAVQYCRNKNMRLPTQYELQSLRNLVTPASEHYNPDLFTKVAQRAQFCTSNPGSVNLSYCPQLVGCTVVSNAWPYDFWGMGFRFAFDGDYVIRIVFDSLGSAHSVRCLPNK